MPNGCRASCGVAGSQLGYRRGRRDPSTLQYVFLDEPHRLPEVFNAELDVASGHVGQRVVEKFPDFAQGKVKLEELKKGKPEDSKGKPQDPKAKAEDPKAQQLTVDDVIKAISDVITAKIPDILIQNQVNRLLSDLIDQTKKLGLTVEQYLASTNRTAESLRADYEKQARQTIILELGLEEIADKEGVIISDDEIDAIIKTAKTEEERKALTRERYYLASLLRRQKTLDKLANIR